MSKKLLAAAMLFAFSSVTWGACKPGNVAGNWTVSVFTAIDNAVLSCGVGVDASGGLTGSCIDLAIGLPATPVAGQMAVNANCALTGFVAIVNRSTFNVLAQLTRNKQIGSGVFIGNFGNVGTITFVRN